MKVRCTHNSKTSKTRVIERTVIELPNNKMYYFNNDENFEVLIFIFLNIPYKPNLINKQPRSISKVKIYYSLSANTTV